MILLFSSVGLWRQQLRPDARVHGIIQEGGTAANIIPDRTRAWFMLRSPDQAYYEEMRQRFNALADAAALATGTSVEVTYSGGAMTMHQNTTLEARWVANAAAYGIVDQGPDPELRQHRHGQRQLGLPDDPPGAVDLPTQGTPAHSILFRDAAAMPQRRRDHAAGGDARRPGRVRAVRRPGARRGGLAGVRGPGLIRPV